MAVQGFALVEPNDPVLEFIVRSNIGGIIGKSGSKTVGLGRDIWTDKRIFALIPSSDPQSDCNQRRLRGGRSKEEALVEVLALGKLTFQKFCFGTTSTWDSLHEMKIGTCKL